MEVEKQVQKAALLLARLRKEDTDFRVFGAESHRYRIGPTLSEEELRTFESKHKIELPPDYRLYLKTVGNGNGDLPDALRGRLGAAGAGPDYGISRLQDTIMSDCTQEPFLYEAETEIEDELDDLGEGDIPGLLYISTPGCTESTHLVVSGTTYGTVWSANNHDHFWPTGLSFTEWICRWAERAIPRVIQERITNSVKVGMSLKEVDEICGDYGSRPYSRSGNYLRFEGLATAFDVNESDIITRIIRHSI